MFYHLNLWTKFNAHIVDRVDNSIFFLLRCTRYNKQI